MGAVDLKSMEGNTRIRPANGRSSSSARGIGRERESETRERTRDELGVGEGEVRAFNAAYWDGRAKGSTADTWWRSANLCLLVGEAERVRADRPGSQADCP